MFLLNPRQRPNACAVMRGKESSCSPLSYIWCITNSKTLSIVKTWFTKVYFSISFLFFKTLHAQTFRPSSDCAVCSLHYRQEKCNGMIIQVGIPNWKLEQHPPFLTNITAGWMVTDFHLHHVVVDQSWFYLICGFCNFVVSFVVKIFYIIWMDKRWCSFSKNSTTRCCRWMESCSMFFQAVWSKQIAIQE